MNWLYLSLNLGSLCIPIIYAFRMRTEQVRHWKPFLISTSIVAILFLIWDAWFTQIGVWQFNENYHLPWKLLGMPMEEWLFFFCIPFASLFIHFILEEYFFGLKLSVIPTYILSFFLFGLAVAILLNNPLRYYTLIVMVVFIIVLFLSLALYITHLQRFYVSFAFIAIGFLVVNGVLTGSLIDQEVVWYDPLHFSGVRFTTIPIEDFFYCFSMLLLNLMIYKWLKNGISYRGLKHPKSN